MLALEESTESQSTLEASLPVCMDLLHRRPQSALRSPQMVSVE